MTQIEYRDKIIQELHVKKTVKKIACRIAYQRHVDFESGIVDDMVQECFVILVRMSPSKVIELYEEGERRLNNYISKIFSTACFGGVTSRPSESLKNKFLFASNFQRNNLYIDTTYDSDGDSSSDDSETLRSQLTDGKDLFESLLMDIEPEPDKYQDLWGGICKQLNEEDVAFLEDYLRRKNGQKTVDRKRFNKLVYKIRNILLPKPEKVKKVKPPKSQKVKKVKPPIPPRVPKPKKEKKPLVMVMDEERRQRIDKRNKAIGAAKAGKPSKRVKPVHQFTLDGQYLKTFPSAKDAADEMGVESNSIAQCCRGITNKSKGYQWSYNKEIFSECG